MHSSAAKRRSQMIPDARKERVCIVFVVVRTSWSTMPGHGLSVVSRKGNFLNLQCPYQRFRMRRIKMMVLILSSFANFQIHWSPFPVRHSLRISPVIQVHPSNIRTRRRWGGTSTGSTNHFSRSFLSRIVRRVNPHNSPPTGIGNSGFV